MTLYIYLSISKLSKIMQMLIYIYLHYINIILNFLPFYSKNINFVNFRNILFI